MIPDVPLNVDRRGYAGGLTRRLNFPGVGGGMSSGLGSFLQQQAALRNQIARAQLAAILQQTQTGRQNQQFNQQMQRRELRRPQGPTTMERSARDAAAMGMGAQANLAHQQAARAGAENAARGEAIRMAGTPAAPGPLGFNRYSLQNALKQFSGGPTGRAMFQGPPAALMGARATPYDRHAYARGGMFADKGISGLASWLAPDAGAGYGQEMEGLGMPGGRGGSFSNASLGLPNVPVSKAGKYQLQPYKSGSLSLPRTSGHSHPYFNNPPYEKGSLPGTVPKTGPANIHKGEVVLSADQVDEPLMAYLMTDKLKKLSSGQMDGKGTGPGMRSYQTGSVELMGGVPSGGRPHVQRRTSPGGLPGWEPPTYSGPYDRPVAPGDMMVPMGPTRGVRVGSGPGPDAIPLGSADWSLVQRDASSLSTKSADELVTLAKAKGASDDAIKMARSMRGKAGLALLAAGATVGALAYLADQDQYDEAAQMLGGGKGSEGELMGPPKELAGDPSLLDRYNKWFIDNLFDTDRPVTAEGPLERFGEGVSRVAGAPFRFAEDFFGPIAEGFTGGSVDAGAPTASVATVDEPLNVSGDSPVQHKSLFDRMLESAEGSKDSGPAFEVGTKGFIQSENAKAEIGRMRAAAQKNLHWMMQAAQGGTLTPELFKTMTEQVNQYNKIADMAQKELERSEANETADRQAGEDRVQAAYKTGVEAHLGNEEAIRRRTAEHKQLQLDFSNAAGQYRSALEDGTDDEARKALTRMVSKYREAHAAATGEIISWEEAQILAQYEEGLITDEQASAALGQLAR